ncbi:CHAD domain-containing protein [Microbacterium hominis]|uniref:CHAD domain-containing protein n=1 Tax=Microbacterium hominis TaxID=162426 RepID=A0A7D4TP96_9MICO|nr:CHAD domain-containing protein [Microbacterium hominis]QKJ20182.1 CHAD domain-containing protein [Microbacterium hominis]
MPHPAPLADLLIPALRTAAAEVADTERAALADEPDGVHQHRVRVRRLRSLLGGVSAHLDAAAVARLRVGYQEWGRQLGAVRDIEVLADLAAEVLDAHGNVDLDMRRRLVDDPRAERAVAHARLVELAQAARAAHRTALLETFAAHPPIVEGEGDAAPAVRAIMRAEARRVRRAAARRDGSAASLHTLRKAGRRLRYVAEGVSGADPSLFPAQLQTFADAGNGIHDALGDHRDRDALAERLDRTAPLAGRAGEEVSAYRELAAELRREAEERLAGIDDLVAAVRAAARTLR